MAGKDIVRVSRSVRAYSSPTFVVEKDGVLYLTVGVLAYDPNAPDLSTEQKRGVQEMQKLYQTATRKDSLRAAFVDPKLLSFGPLQSGPSPGGGGEADDDK